MIVKIHLQKVVAMWGLWGQRSEILHGTLYGQYTCHRKIQAQSREKKLIFGHPNAVGIVMKSKFQNCHWISPPPKKKVFKLVLKSKQCILYYPQLLAQAKDLIDKCLRHQSRTRWKREKIMKHLWLKDDEVLWEAKGQMETPTRGRKGLLWTFKKVSVTPRLHVVH